MNLTTPDLNGNNGAAAINQNEINAILWKACDTFRGTIDPSEYKNYILVMLFLKYISDVWRERYAQLQEQYGDNEARIRRQACRVLGERLAALLPRFAQFNLAEPELAIRSMKSRWGSCSQGGKINLNLKLMQAPKACIDYVLVHELCHLVEHNHSKRFYQLLDRMMPDWRERRRQLNGVEVG